MTVTSIPSRLLRRRFEALCEHLPESVTGDAIAVHQARVGSRRLREVLPVVGPAAGVRRLQRAMKHVRLVTRALGPVRELDVALEVLQALEREDPAISAPVRAVSTVVARAREDEGETMRAALRASAIKDTERAVESVLRRLERTPDLGDWRRPLAERLATRATSLADAITAVGLLFDPPRLHLVRIAAKKLRYSLELAGEARLGGTRNAVSTLKKSQEQLGRLHDLQVVLVYVRQAQAEADRRRQPGLRSLRDLIERQCLREHARYLRSRDDLARTRAFALALARRIRAASPSLVRGPRPPLSRGTRHD